MHRIDHSTRRIDANGAGKDGFFEGDAVTHTPRTRVTDDWLNGVQEEIASAIEGFGAPLVKGIRDQLFRSVRHQGLRSAVGQLAEDSAPAVGQLYSVDQGGGDVVAVGAGGAIVTSTVVHGGFGGDITASGSDNWTQRSSPGGGSYTDDYGHVRYDETLKWLAVGNAGALHTATDPTSTWTAQSAAGSYTGNFGKCAFGNGVAIALGATGGTSEIQRSTNLTSWASISHTNIDGALGIAYSPTLGRWLVGGLNGKILSSDDDGLTWSSETLADSYSSYVRLEWDSYGERFVMTGNGGVVQYSADGSTWSSGTSENTGAILQPRSMRGGLVLGGTSLVSTTLGGLVSEVSAFVGVSNVVVELVDCGHNMIGVGYNSSTTKIWRSPPW